MNQPKARIAIIGGGPAGLAAALAALGAGVQVVVFERLPRVGTKLAATGGGRGNVAHVGDEQAFADAFGRRGRFGIPAWRALGGADGLRRKLARLGVETVVDGEGRVYPASMHAEDVRAAMEGAIRREGGEVQCAARVETLERTPQGDWLVDGTRFVAVVLAAGGQSAPELGSDGSGFALARQLGHRVVAPVPGLAPLLLEEPWLSTHSGTSVDNARLRLRAGHRTVEVRGAVLATHFGLSGPAALAISGAVAREWTRTAGAPDVRLELGLVPGPLDWEELRRSHGAQSLRQLLAAWMPKKLAVGLLEHCGCPGDQPVARLDRAQRDRLERALTAEPLHLRGIAPFAQSMVTCGGVDLKEVAPDTLASRLVPALFLAGEVLDLDAPSGGWNLLWAFASGALAGRSAAQAIGGGQTS